MNAFLADLTLWALPVLLAITLHEAAHGYVARAFGDPTAERAGRISLNPLRHVDPVGTLLVPLGILLLSLLTGAGALLFGWAKPVPVDPSRLRHPKRDMFWVAGAGPGINLAMALGWALLFKLSLTFLPPFWAVPLARMADAGISINVALMVLNLLPLPPLDGGRMLVSVLPPRPAWALSRLEPYGIAILLVAMISGVGSSILWPMFVAVRSTILATIGF
ncbi:site-2 protease family protein [Tepidiphilus baoligensis]|uniref:Site-2 protease family protein n=1 Tax=Tepidiphilus baoligensis TaxID=2698687 RepID=A0ABX1QJM4_9PROT|nr:site-2 protease family protein [Tepidiphilus baoligensis]NMH15929.1 site-2 protease family protein [Tepidiphilus baoligensis]